MLRQIFLDTETTGLEIRNGNRIIEIAGIGTDPFYFLSESSNLNPTKKKKREVKTLYGRSSLNNISPVAAKQTPTKIE